MSGSGPGEIVFRHMSVVQRSVRSVSCRHRSRKPPESCPITDILLDKTCPIVWQKDVIRQLQKLLDDLVNMPTLIEEPNGFTDDPHPIGIVVLQAMGLSDDIEASEIRQLQC
jgi:hypothetical protein